MGGWLCLSRRMEVSADCLCRRPSVAARVKRHHYAHGPPLTSDSRTLPFHIPRTTGMADLRAQVHRRLRGRQYVLDLSAGDDGCPWGQSGPEQRQRRQRDAGDASRSGTGALFVDRVVTWEHRGRGALGLVYGKWGLLGLQASNRYRSSPDGPHADDKSGGWRIRRLLSACSCVYVG